MDVEEVQVDVSGDRQRAIFDRSRPFYMPGFRVTYYVPFRGDKDGSSVSRTPLPLRPLGDFAGFSGRRLVDKGGYSCRLWLRKWMRYSAARKQSARRKFIFRQCHPGAVLARKSAQ